MSKPVIVLMLCLAAITTLLFWPATHFDYVNFDDDVYVYENPHVQHGLKAEEISWAFRDHHVAFWLPMTWLSFMLDSQLFGHQAAAYHATNIVFHTLNVLLLFLFFYRATGAMWRSAVVAALFAWHPLRVESVVWVTERKDVLTTFFALLSLHAYFTYVKNKTAIGAAALGMYLVALLCYALSLMAKPLLVTWPFALLLLDFWPLHRVRDVSFKTMRALLLEKLPFLLIALLFSAITLHVAEKSVANLPLNLRVANALVSYVKYISHTFWPVGLNIYYPYPESIPQWQTIGAIVLLATITIPVVRVWRKQPWLAVGWFWFLGTLVPNIGVVQSGQQAMADRFVYVPLIGLFASVVWLGAEMFQRLPMKAVAPAVSGFILSGCVLMTRHLLPFWENSETVCTRALSVTKNNYFVHQNYGAVLFQHGQAEQAEKHFRESIRIRPDFTPAHNNLALICLQKGQTNEAMEQFAISLQLKNDNFSAHFNLANLLAEQGKLDEAVSHFQQAIALEAEDPDAHFHFGSLLLRQNKIGETIAQWREAVRLRPDWPDLCNNLAWLLSTTDDANVRNGREAVELAERACRSSAPLPDYFATLAAAYAEAGRFHDAVAANEKAIAGSKGAHDLATLAKLEKRTELYVSQRTLREK